MPRGFIEVALDIVQCRLGDRGRARIAAVIDEFADSTADAVICVALVLRETAQGTQCELAIDIVGDAEHALENGDSL